MQPVEKGSAIVEERVTIELFGVPKVTRNGAEVSLGSALPLLAMLILLRDDPSITPEGLAYLLRPRSEADDPVSFLKKRKQKLVHLLALDLPKTLKPSDVTPIILQQAEVDVVHFDQKITSADSREVRDAVTRRQRGPLLAGWMEPEGIETKRQSRETKYQEALWRLIQEDRYESPKQAVRLIDLLLDCPDLPQKSREVLREDRLALEHDIFRAKPPHEDKTTLGWRPPKLPSPLTEIIGRDAALEAIQSLLSAHRLVTLEGTGGIGKTRLGLAAAHHLQERFAHGAAFAELSAVPDAAQLSQQVGLCLGLEREEDRKPATLLAFLEDKSLLLVWDNCEHLVEACAALAADLLTRCPAVRILTTSREMLRAYGEACYPVSALPEPDAVALFTARAKAVQFGFRLTPENTPAVRTLCRDLDGLPLAIELAAALVNSQTPQQVASKLSQRLDLLSDGPRSAPARHRSLRAAFDVSYALLEPAEQALFRCLGMFTGSFSGEAAAAVSELLPADVPALLGQLVRKSVVLAELSGGEIRYRLLTTIKQYAEEQMQRQGEQDESSRKYRIFFLKLAEEAEPQLRGPHQKQWLDRLEIEIDNLRAVLLLCGGDTQQSKEETIRRSETHLHLSGLLLPLWQMRGHLSEGRQWLDKALQQCKEAEVNGQVDTIAEPKGRALWAAGMLALCQNDYEAAQVLTEESLEVRRQLEDTAGIAACLNSLGSIAAKRGDGRAATLLFRESLSLRRQVRDKQAISGSLNNLGLLARDQGNHEEAATLFKDSLEIRRQLGNPEDIASSLNNLGMLAAFQGNYTDGIALLRESLTIYRLLQSQHEIAHILRSLGSLALMQRDFGLAKTHEEESLSIYRKLNNFLHASVTLCILGGIALQQGNCDLAEAHYKEGLVVLKRIEHPLARIYGLEGYSAVTHTQNRLDLTAKLIGAAQSYRSAVNVPLPPVEQKEAIIQTAEVQAAMGAEAFGKALAEGHAMSWEQAVALALGETED